MIKESCLVAFTVIVILLIILQLFHFIGFNIELEMVCPKIKHAIKGIHLC